MLISIIAAIGKNRELGKNNKLLWDIPEDLQRFRTITKGHPVIMGSRTFESIGHPLPARPNIIITRDNNYQKEGCFIVHSLNDAIELAKQKDDQEIFIIGGGQIYEQALPLTDKLYLTVVDATFDADTFFPDYSQFSKIVSKNEHQSNGYHYTFFELTR